MGFTVRLLPSGHAFDAEPHETLLEAALRSGLNLNYRCLNGSCGSCKGRLISGQLGERRFHDYVLTEAEKGQAVFLLCSNSAASDVVVEASEAQGSEDIPLQSILARVARLERPTRDHLVLYLRTPRTQTLRFLAGQSVKLRFDGESGTFAVASCPCNGMILQFHMRLASSSVSQRLVDASVGSEVGIEGPFGDFTRDEESSRPIAFVAVETGFAPVKSLLEHAVALELPQDLLLFWIANDRTGHYLLNHARSLADAVDNLELRPLVGAKPAGVAESLSQMLNKERWTIYLAGPKGFVEPLEHDLRRRGFSSLCSFVDT